MASSQLDQPHLRTPHHLHCMALDDDAVYWLCLRELGAERIDQHNRGIGDISKQSGAAEERGNQENVYLGGL